MLSRGKWCCYRDLLVVQLTTVGGQLRQGQGVQLQDATVVTLSREIGREIAHAKPIGHLGFADWRSDVH